MVDLSMPDALAITVPMPSKPILAIFHYTTRKDIYISFQHLEIIVNAMQELHIM